LPRRRRRRRRRAKVIGAPPPPKNLPRRRRRRRAKVIGAPPTKIDTNAAADCAWIGAGFQTVAEDILVGQWDQSAV